MLGKQAEIQKEEENIESFWLLDVMKAISENHIPDARKRFEEHQRSETDTIKRESDKAFFLRLLFGAGADDTAISQLERMAYSATDEGLKQNILTHLSVCFRQSARTKDEIEHWEQAIGLFKSARHVTKAIISLADALMADKRPQEAKGKLTERLRTVSSNEEKYDLFMALSEAESSMGNYNIAVYCKDKALEFDPDNRGGLFQAAYQASKQNINDIAVRNYETLLGMDRNNFSAWNNRAVLAAEADINIKAADGYRTASNLGETLAMANQGRLLLNAGFAYEAKKIAEEAAKMENPHENVYSLLRDIPRFRREQEEKWQKLVDKVTERQGLIREYTNARYFGPGGSFEGKWILPDGKEIDIEISGDELKAAWQESTGYSPIGMGLFSSVRQETRYNIELSGKVTLSSFEGTYTKLKEGEKRESISSLLIDSSTNPDIPCIGYLSDGGMALTLLAKDYKKDFSLLLKKSS